MRMRVLSTNEMSMTDYFSHVSTEDYVSASLRSTKRGKDRSNSSSLLGNQKALAGKQRPHIATIVFHSNTSDRHHSNLNTVSIIFSVLIKSTFCACNYFYGAPTYVY